MRYFQLLNFQHLMLVFFPTLVFIIVFALALGCHHFRHPDSERRHKEILYKYPEDIEDKNGPFPIVMGLIVAGTVIWAFFYILMNGLLGVKI